MACIGEEVARAEDSMLSGHYRTAERKESRRSASHKALVDEFMQAASLPLFSSVSTPTVKDSRRRLPFLDVFGDSLFWSKNTALAARALAVLMRHDRGLVEDLAAQHADDYAEEVQ